MDPKEIKGPTNNDDHIRPHNRDHADAVVGVNRLDCRYSAAMIAAAISLVLAAFD